VATSLSHKIDILAIFCPIITTDQKGTASCASTMLKQSVREIAS